MTPGRLVDRLHHSTGHGLLLYKWIVGAAPVTELPVGCSEAVLGLATWAFRIN